MDPMSTLSALASVLSIIDVTAGQLRRFRDHEPDSDEPKPHRVLAEQQDDVIVFKEGEYVVEMITAAELEYLDPDDKEFIKAIEKSMYRQKSLWLKLYPDRFASADPVVNAKVNDQMQVIGESMCKDLDKILSFLINQLHKNLHDHYNSVRFICQDIESDRGAR